MPRHRHDPMRDPDRPSGPPSALVLATSDAPPRACLSRRPARAFPCSTRKLSMAPHHPRPLSRCGHLSPGSAAPPEPGPTTAPLLHRRRVSSCVASGEAHCHNWLEGRRRSRNVTVGHVTPITPSGSTRNSCAPVGSADARPTRPESRRNCASERSSRQQQCDQSEEQAHAGNVGSHRQEDRRGRGRIGADAAQQHRNRGAGQPGEHAAR